MKSKLMLILIFFIFLSSIVAVSAIDDANETIINNEDILSVNNDDISYSINENDDESILTESDNSTHFGYWVSSDDVSGLNLTDLSKNGVTDILLNCTVYEKYNKSYVESLALDAKENGINIHIWVEIFKKEGKWIRPIDSNGTVNNEYFDNKTAELEYYANTKGIAGIHYDYLRFSGSESHNNTGRQNPGGKEAIIYFANQSSEAIRKINPNLIISAAFMPEPENLEPYYGDDYPELSKYFDVVIPRTFKGDYKENTTWINNITKYFVENSQGGEVWSGLQGYVNDDDDKNFLPEVQIDIDSNSALDAGAKGIMISKWNNSKNIDFNNLSVDENQLNSFEYLFYMISSAYETLNLENDFTFNESTDNEFIDGIKIYNNNTVINGNNHIIDGKNMARIFNITAFNVTLENIQFKNAFTNNTGAASYITGNYVKIINCTFSDNVAKLEAAAIFLIGNDAYIHNCTFVNNSAKYTGAVLIRSHNGCITDSRFENNTAEISAAAIGLAFRNNTSIINTVFINNGAYNEGGAAIFVNNALNTKIINSTFLDNYAHYNGAGIFWSYGHNGSVVNSTFINNTATEKGGAIYHIGDDITLTGNIFKDNEGVNGSAIYLNKGSNNILSKNVIVSNGIYINNLNDSEIRDSIILDEIISNNSTVIYTNDWFGNTKNNFNESLNEYADNWLYLNASANKTMVGEDASVKFYFDQFNGSQSPNLPEITLKLVANNLILDNDTVMIDESVDSQITDYGAYINASYENIEFKYELPIADINIFTNNITKYYGNPQRFIVTVLDSNSNPISNKTVNITINGQKYSKKTNENGTASIGVNLNSGTYNVTASVDNVSVCSEVTVLSTIEANDIVKVFRNNTQYFATFVDTDGKALKNTKVKFNINGIMYERNTNENGTAKLNINLAQGKYIITAINPVNGEMHANNVTVLSSIANNTDLIKYYKNDSQYVVKILGADGNPVGAGKTVSFNINGVFYNRTTNETGHAKLNINLSPGEYIITADYNGCLVSNNITVLTTLETKDLVMKYKDGSAFEAKVLDGQGNVYANQEVQFNINGVYYNRTTGEDGIAKLNINLMAGEYIITSIYNGYAAGNKITIS